MERLGCTGCRATVIWAVHKGKPIRLDAKPIKSFTLHDTQSDPEAVLTQTYQRHRCKRGAS